MNAINQHLYIQFQISRKSGIMKAQGQNCFHHISAPARRLVTECLFINHLIDIIHIPETSSHSACSLWICSVFPVCMLHRCLVVELSITPSKSLLSTASMPGPGHLVCVLCLHWLNTTPVEACSTRSMLASSLSTCLRSTRVVASSSTLFLCTAKWYSLSGRPLLCFYIQLHFLTIFTVLSLKRLFKNDHMIRIVP